MTTYQGTPDSDTLLGSNADDLFFGDAGNDTMTGNGGLDTYHFDLNVDNGIDLITDFGRQRSQLRFQNGYVLSLNEVSDPTRLERGQAMIVHQSASESWFLLGTDTAAGVDLTIRLGEIDVRRGRFKLGEEGALIIYSPGLDLIGTSGQNYLRGGLGDDSIDGAAGNDNIYGYEGSDTLLGDEGNDWLGGAVGTSPVPLAGDLADLLIGGNGHDHLRGNLGDDTLIGGEGDDNLRGDHGNDWLDGGSGLDFVSYHFDPLDLPYGVRLDGSELVGMGERQIDDQLGGIDILISIERLGFSGTKYNDTVFGSSGADQLWGLAGDDWISAGAGNDLNLTGDDGHDTLYGGEGDDYLMGESNSGYTSWGNDYLYGGSGHDTLVGHEGDDIIDGGDGIDTILYYFSNVNPAGDVLIMDSSLLPIGSSSSIKLSDGVGGVDEIINVERVNISGSSFSDSIIGSAGSDQISGRLGDDTIDGGQGELDMARYFGLRNEYTISPASNGYFVVTHSYPPKSGEGTDHLKSIEILQFSDQKVVVADLLLSSGLTGMAYHWKSHALLGGVEVQALDRSAIESTPSAKFDLRHFQLDPVTGQLTVEVWVNPGVVVESLDFTVNGPLGSSVSFELSLDTSWTSLRNAFAPGQMIVGAFLSDFSKKGLAEPTRVGKLTLEVPVDSTDIQIGFTEIRIGEAPQADMTLAVAGATTTGDGRYEFNISTGAEQLVTASRKAGDGTNGVTSADALAALKIAVGINPNADPDGEGPKSALPVSPYQIMAADANQDGKVGASDALSILRMAVKDVNAPAQEWFFVEETRDFWNEETSKFSLDRLNAAWDRSIDASQTSRINLVGVLKGDVNGSWTPPVGSAHVDALDPAYFLLLAELIGVPMEQFGIDPGP